MKEEGSIFIKILRYFNSAIVKIEKKKVIKSLITNHQP